MRTVQSSYMDSFGALLLARIPATLPSTSWEHQRVALPARRANRARPSPLTGLSRCCFAAAAVTCGSRVNARSNQRKRLRYPIVRSPADLKLQSRSEIRKHANFHDLV